MATGLGGVFMTDTDGNIGQEVSNLTEKVSGLLFDISAQKTLWTSGAGVGLAETFKDNVVEFNSLAEAVAAGITPYTGTLDDEDASLDFFCGIPYYHIAHFFGVAGGTGRLFVSFADCTNNWDALVDMQKAAHGDINQFGVWTEQMLWKKLDDSATSYSTALVGDLQSAAETLANEYNAPASILLSANTASVKVSDSTQNTVTWSEIPSCVIGARYVSVLLGQSMDADVSAMQVALTTHTPVGAVGAALGCLASATVSECIGWVQQFNLINYFPDIAFGFGNSTISDGALTSTTKYSSLSSAQINMLADAGYVFLCKYSGLEGGVYFANDTTCSDGDYRTIARNRAINKSRRSVRTALLPYVNSPIKVDPATGQLSAAQITVFTNTVTSILQAMVDAEEISGIGKVYIPATQNILTNDRLTIQYTIVPIGCANQIVVTEGLVMKQ